MFFRYLNGKLQEKAVREFNEDPERLKEDVRIIMEWVNKEPHLIAKPDPQIILNYLRGSKYSIEKVKRKLENLYTMRTLLYDWMHDRNPFSPVIQELIQQCILLPCIKTESEVSPRLIIIKHISTVKYKIKDMCIALSMISDILLKEDDQLALCGMTFIHDLDSITLSDITHLDLVAVKKTLTFLNKAYPENIYVYHIINVPDFAEAIIQTIKTFVPKKSGEKWAIHKRNDLESLQKFVPKSVLPNEYGGEGGPIQESIDYWKAKLESYADWFKEESNYRSDESKRIGKAVTSNDVFGVEGSFRKLAVD